MKLRVTSEVTEQDIAEVHAALKAYNLAHREPSKSIPLGIFLEEDGKKLAGLTGEIFGSWLCIKYLFVSEDLRGQGIGSRLLAAAEAEAVRHGAVHAFVDTFSFQAPEFYLCHGYHEVFRLTDYPYTGARYYYTKDLP